MQRIPTSGHSLHNDARWSPARRRNTMVTRWGRPIGLARNYKGGSLVVTAVRFLENPRAFQRFAVRCPVAVTRRGGAGKGETVDVSAGGCQIVTTEPLHPGELLKLDIEAQGVPQPLRVSGVVAWVADLQGRPRAGISYSPRQTEGDPVAWLARLLEVRPEIEGRTRRQPRRFSTDMKLFLGPPPRFIFDFGDREVAVLRTIGDGITIEDLLRANLFPVETLARIVFALLEQGFATVRSGEAVRASAWTALLALEGGPGATPPPTRVAPAPPAPIARPTEAQECFDLAVSALSMNEVSTAMGLLRRALELCPGDPEISKLLGQYAFRGRSVENP